MTTTDETTATPESSPLIQDVNWKIDYRVKLGRAWSRFMRGLQKQELWGTRCADCQRVYVPAQDYCEACYSKIEEWVLLDPVGTLDTASIIYQGFDGGPEAPYAVGAIHIDGTDALLMHFVGGVDLADSDSARAKLAGGLRVRAVWAKDRTASINDILHFAPTDD